MFAYHYLAHEVGDDAVEGGALVAVALLPGAQRAEVLAGLGHHVASQLKSDNVTTSDYSHNSGIQKNKFPSQFNGHSLQLPVQTNTARDKARSRNLSDPPSMPRLLLGTMNS